MSRTIAPPAPVVAQQWRQVANTKLYLNNGKRSKRRTGHEGERGSGPIFVDEATTSHCAAEIAKTTRAQQACGLSRAEACPRVNPWGCRWHGAPATFGRPHICWDFADPRACQFLGQIYAAPMSSENERSPANPRGPKARAQEDLERKILEGLDSSARQMTAANWKGLRAALKARLGKRRREQ